MSSNSNQGEISKVYILGLGAIGSTYASKLHDWDPEVVRVIAGPNRMAALSRKGVVVNGKTYHFNLVSPTLNPRSAGHPEHAHLILIATKFSDLEQSIEDIRRFVGPNTIVLSLLNGILSEEIIGEAIGMEHMLYAFSTANSIRKDGNIRDIEYLTMGKIHFGEKKNEQLSPRVRAVKALFEKAGIDYTIPVDMYKALWKKFMYNTGVNQASAILKAPFGEFQHPGPARELMLMAAKEVVQLSQRAGVNLGPSELDDFVATINILAPTFKTSFLQDLEAGRRTELDNFAGAVIKLGKKYGMPTPVNDVLYLILKTMEQMAQRQLALPLLN